jgi:hypothetical protein
MKKLVILIFAVLLNAEVVDRVIGVVNNLPITSYELSKVQKEMHLNKAQAINYLIDQKLIESEIKKYGIYVDDYDVEMYVEKIAKQNGMTPYDFKIYMGAKYPAFIKKLKKEIAKNRLFNKIVQNELKINIDKLKDFYNKHKNRYEIFNKIEVKEYKARTPNELQNMLFAPTKTYSYKDLPLRLLMIFKNTKEGNFTPVLEDGIYYKRYYVVKKIGKAYLPFDKIKDMVANDYAAAKREEILREYFDKLKNRANIKIYN